MSEEEDMKEVRRKVTEKWAAADFLDKEWSSSGTTLPIVRRVISELAIRISQEKADKNE